MLLGTAGSSCSRYVNCGPLKKDQISFWVLLIYKGKPHMGAVPPGVALILGLIEPLCH